MLRLFSGCVSRDYCLVVVLGLPSQWLLLCCVGSRVLGLQQLQPVGSAVCSWAPEHGLSTVVSMSTRLVAPWHVGSS